MEPDDEFDSVPFDSFTAEEEAKLLRVLKDPQTAPFVLAPGVAAGAPLDEVDAAAAEDNAPDDGDGALPKVLVEIESSQGGLALGNNGGQEEQRRAEQQEQEMLRCASRHDSILRCCHELTLLALAVSSSATDSREERAPCLCLT